ncbi:MAG: hypothetical protein IJB43_09690 [Clostridia bacterium]|nr:hypothetical protein [Clostridia bacterium]
MKKVISIFFTLCLVVALSLSASAESNKLTYAVGASAPTVSANTEFTIIVEVTENTGICWLKAVVTYDSSVLTYVDYSTDTSIFDKSLITVNSSVKADQGKIIIVIGSFDVISQASPKIYTNTGKLITLKFKANEGVASGTSTVVDVNTTQSNIVKKVDGVSAKDFKINNASTTIKVMDADHKCVPGTAKKENEVPATCTNVGSYDEVVRCTVCSNVISSKTIVVPPNDKHTPGTAVKENEKAGDCKNAGTYDSVVYCTLCSKEVSRTKKTGEKGDHVAGTPEVTVTDATCLKKGSIVEIYKCKVCGIQMDKKTSELPIADHIEMNPVTENVVAATCTKGGSYVSVVRCATCNKVLSSETKTTEIIPHTPAKAVEENRKEPVNCGANGTYDSVVYCSVCKKEISRVQQAIPAPKHTPGPEPTETTAQICTVCNALLAPAIGHTHHWVGTWSSDNTGHWYACSGCSEKKDFAEHTFENNCDADCNICGYKRTPGDHVYGSWNTVKEPTATTEGLRERLCILCANKITESIPATGVVTTTPPETTEEPVVTTTPVDTTTEPTPGTSEPDVTTESTPGTSAPEVTDPDVTTEPDVEDPGCGSAVSMGIALIAILGTALIMKKRD